eukprot:gene31661-38262_t
MSTQYSTAASLVRQVKEGKSLKRIINESSRKVEKSHYAIAVETLKHEHALLQIAKAANLPLEDDNGVSYMKLVMMYDLIFGRGDIKSGGAIKKEIMEYASALRSAKATFHEGNSDAVDEAVVEASQLPIHVRINTIKCSFKEGMDHINSLYPTLATRDAHIPSLIHLPVSAKAIVHDSWVKQGKLIVQDKASCFPAYVLFQEWKRRNLSGDFLDACAAPGNKTSHLAAQLHEHITQHTKAADAPQSAKIFAFDKNPERCATLKSRLANAGAGKLVQVANQDFLRVNVHDPKYARVQCVLLDPSCSGSGIARDITRLLDAPVDDAAHLDRVQKLQGFQSKCLARAAEFPGVQCVAYSTCSVHSQENEEVVRRFLASAVGQQFELRAPDGLASWPRRGIRCNDNNSSPSNPSDNNNNSTSNSNSKSDRDRDRDGAVAEDLSDEQRAMLIRCAVQDGMNGFFVALFVRKDEHIQPIPHTAVEAVQETDGDVGSVRTAGLSGKKRQREGKEVIEQVDAQPSQPAASSQKKRRGESAEAAAAAAAAGGALFGKGGFRIGRGQKRRFGKR